MSPRLELCRVCWWLGPTYANEASVLFMEQHDRPAVQGGRPCVGSRTRPRPDWDDCASPGCEHRPDRHLLAPEDDLPMVLWSAPCSIPGCECLDYDGMNHPERPSIAEAVVYRDDHGGDAVA